jgi:amino acid permease
VAVSSAWATCIDHISNQAFERTFKSFDIKGVPYFFGICTFAFEGNTVTLEIYSKMQHKDKNFTKALALGIGLATFLFMMTGTLFYNAYGQFT